MKKYHVWIKGPYSAAWEKATAAPLEKKAAVLWGTESAAGKAAVTVIVIAANIDPNKPGASNG